MAKKPEKDSAAPPPPPPKPPPASPPAQGEKRRSDSVRGTNAEGLTISEEFLKDTGHIEQEVIEIAARDIERSTQHEMRLAQEKSVKRESFYSDLIFTLTNLRYDEAEARVLWVNLLTHKLDMSDRLGRNVGIRVAGLDYFKNIIGALDEVKIVDASSYIETAQLAVTDGLTGIFNHRYFQDRLQRDIARAKEEDSKVSLLMIDIDYFKQYNDINGHIAGDVALKEVAICLRRNLKKGDMVARYGGEEFAVILVGLDREGAKGVAERIRQVILDREFPNEKVLPGGNLTVSIGLAEYPMDGEERGALIQAADRALYVAKHSGKNRVCQPPRDRRNQKRHPISAKVKFQHSKGKEDGVEAKAVDARTSDLSMGGLCMLTSENINQGELLYLVLDGMPDTKPILGRVMWTDDQDETQRRLGIRFVNVSPEDQEVLRKLLGE
ncbi:MAG: diguanylate cyclase [Planctomycetes bacterium]|nr:diguanylate cyclase [Planctomycetota bacterium]